MISKKLLSLQELNLIRDFKEKYPEIYDIVIFGSFVRGKLDARDLDLAILFYKAKLADKLRLAQELKQKLKDSNYEIDVKGVDFNDLLDKDFIARQAIIAESYSLFKKKRLAELLGFSNYYLFAYSLKGLSQSKKIMFQYALKGRRGQKGIIETRNCRQIGRGAVMVPLENSEEFRDFLEKNRVNYKIHKGLFY